MSLRKTLERYLRNISENADSRQKKLYKTSLFTGKFLIAGIVFQLILYINPDTYQVQAAFTTLMAFLLSVAGLELTYTGIRIFTSEAVYVIVQDCLGWKSMAVFIALIYASTSRTLEHLKYILIGLLVLVIANIVRVFTTVYLSEIGLISFEVIHGTLWRWSLTIVVLALWIYWFNNLKDKEMFETRIKDQLNKVKSE